MSRQQAIEQAANEIAMALTRKGYINIKNGKDETRIDALYKALAMPETAEAVAVVDANDDGYFAEILPDRDVKIGQNLYAHPPKADAERVVLLARLDSAIANLAPNSEFLREIRTYLGGA